MFCAACRAVRPAEELLAFWPVRDPSRRRHVCRPSLQRPEVPSCFRELVGPANVHSIARADSIGLAALALGQAISINLAQAGAVA